MITPHADLASGSPLRDLLEAAAIPVVLVERALDDRVAERLDWVRSDHAAGAETAVDHLLSLGHSRIVLAARPAATVGALREGFDRRLSDNASVAVGTWHPLSTPPAGRGVLIPELEALIDTCLDERATAALILGDADAMAFADLVIGRGLLIPEDIAIVAYDDEISGHAAIPLTAVAPPKRELGSAAVRLCMDRMRQHEHGSQTIIRMVMLPTLVARESTIGAGAA
ncbi:MAG: substrate-binding domain-containing protein [Microbacterium sp.]|nr:substrate-binding domain-containing protein [Microbacterium sp.]